jgi:hypothetical protein
MSLGSGLARGSLMMLLFLLAYFQKSLVFHPKDASLDKMSLMVAGRLLSESSRRLLWFDIERRLIRLNSNVLLDWGGLTILAVTPTQTKTALAATAVKKPIRLSADKYIGTFAATLPPLTTDFNNDGTRETIKLAAKIDTLYTPDKSYFHDLRMPLELARDNRGILVFFRQKPLKNRRLRLLTRLGKGQSVTTDESGIMKVPDIRHLRQGISVIYQTGRYYYITDYLLESYSIFSGRHLTALQPLLKVLGLAGLLIGIILLAREKDRRRKRYLVSGTLSPRLAGTTSE